MSQWGQTNGGKPMGTGSFGSCGKSAEQPSISSETSFLSISFSHHRLMSVFPHGKGEEFRRASLITSHRSAAPRNATLRNPLAGHLAQECFRKYTSKCLCTHIMTSLGLPPASSIGIYDSDRNKYHLSRRHLPRMRYAVQYAPPGHHRSFGHRCRHPSNPVLAHVRATKMHWIAIQREMLR